MKNLKKVLALALATVMMFGMMVVGASAAYKDQADIDATAAVAVMSAIQAIEGDDEGNYNPGNVLCRADAAVIAARVALTRGVANNLAGVATTYSDVVAGSYYSGAVAWATNEGILAGDGTGKFNPWDDLGGYAFAKMLLCVLGYDAEIEGYVNTPDWAVNINFDAMMAGLLTGLEGVDLNGPLTREQAAIMAFNAVTACQSVEYKSTLGAVNGVLTTVYERDDKGLVLCTKYGLAYVPASYDTDEVIGGYWTIGGKAIVDSVEAVEASIVLTGTQKAEDLAKTLKGYTFNTTVAKDVAALAALSGNGVTLSLYVDYTNPLKPEICVIEESHEAYAQVTNVVTDRNGEVTKITADGVEYKPAAKDAEPTLNNLLFDNLLALGVKKGDVLAATVVDGVVCGFDFAAVETGKVTKVTKDGFTASGAEYAPAKGVELTVSLGAELNIYLDSNGYVLAVAAVVPDAPQQPAPDYIYVLEAGYESVRGTKTYYFAGVTMDGTEVEATYVPHKNQQGVVDFTTFDIEAVEGAENDWKAIEKLVAYTEKDGVYTFANATDAAIVGTDAIAKGALQAENGAYFSANVQFLFFYTKNAKGETVLNPTFVDGVCALDAGTEYYYFTSKDAVGQTIIDLVVVTDADVTAPEAVKEAPKADYVDGIYMLKTDITTDSFSYYTIVEDADPSKTVVLGATSVYLDGEKVELLVKQDVAQDGSYSVKTIEAGLWLFELDANGAVKSMLNVAETDTKDVTVDVKTLTLNKGDVVYVNGKYYVDGLTEATDAVIYDIAESKDGINDTLDVIYANVNAGDTVEVTVVTETVKGVTTVTTIVVTGYTYAG